MSVDDLVERFARIIVWVLLGISAYAWYDKNPPLWRGSLLAVLIITMVAVDTGSKWVRDEVWCDYTLDEKKKGRTLLNIASGARLAAWISWGVGIIYTPSPLFEICWVLGGVCWGINAILIMLYAFDKNFDTIFKEKELNRGRAVFRLIIHDVAGAILVCVLGATLNDVFDGDADDSHWRSMLSGAIIFQIFYTFWSHWGDLHVDKGVPCCHRDMRTVWRTVARFASFFTLFIVILTRAHEDIVLVDMGMSDFSLIFTLTACSILSLTNMV